MAQNAYALLGVAQDASTADIRKAYRALAAKLHPDRNPGDKEAERKFKELSSAYETLSDPTRRRTYDQGPAPRPRPTVTATAATTGPRWVAPGARRKPGPVPMSSFSSTPMQTGKAYTVRTGPVKLGSVPLTDPPDISQMPHVPLFHPRGKRL